MRFVLYLVLLALVGYGIWPFYSVYQLDEAMNLEDTSLLSSMVDLEAIRNHTKGRLAAGMDGILPAEDPSSVMGWIRQNLDRLGDSALEQAITQEWVQQSLRDAVIRATGQTPPYLIGGIDFAFFESPNRFLIRIGELGLGATHVRLERQGQRWLVTDIIP